MDNYDPDPGKHIKSIVQRMASEEHRENSLDFSKIGGCVEVKEVLLQAIAYRVTVKVAAHFAYKSVLLFGPSGTGKSLVAKCAIGECEKITGKPFTMYNVSVRRLLFYPGKAVKLIDELFNSARFNKFSVIIIDEIEALVPSQHSGDRVLSQVAVCFLRHLETIPSGVTLIGLTTRPQEMNQWISDSFSQRIYVPLPSEIWRKDILSVLMKTKFNSRVCWRSVDISKIAKATTGYSGCDLERLIQQASHSAVMDTKAKCKGRNCKDSLFCVQMKHIFTTVKTLRASITFEKTNFLDGLIRYAIEHGNGSACANLREEIQSQRERELQRRDLQNRSECYQKQTTVAAKEVNGCCVI